MLQMNPEKLQIEPPSESKPKRVAYDSYLMVGFGLIAALIVGFFTWSFFAPIQGAVIAPGTVVVEGKPKTLQHLDGGIVGEILVVDGDVVREGDVVMRLDPTSLNANRDLLNLRLNEAEALRARLIAERDNLSRVPWRSKFPIEERTPALELIIQDQEKLFETRRQAYRGEVSQLQKRLEQANEQIVGFQSQSVAIEQQLEINTRELAGLRELFKEGHVSETRVLNLEREQASLSGEVARISAEIARTRTAISETEIEILQVTRARAETALTELRIKESEISDLEQQLIMASDQVGRVDILAPVSGRVHNMTVTTLGGVITPANPIMDIIPDTARLIVESRVEPSYVDQLYLGQSTTVRLSAFNQRTTPELNGEVSSISANTTIDEITGAPYYTVKIEIPPEELSRLNGLVLVPGMPAEAFMQTDERTVVNYLLKPATDQLTRAFREE